MQRYIVDSKESGQTLEKYVKKVLNAAPLSFIYKLFRKKDVKVNGHWQKEKYIINEGEGGGNFVGRIVNVSADESVLTDGKIDYKKLHIITFDPVGAKYVALGEEVALAFREGLKLK